MAEKVTDPELLAILNGESSPPAAAPRASSAKNPKLSREAQKQWNVDHGLDYDIRRPTAPDFVGISKDEQSGLENFQPAKETNNRPTVVTDPELLARLNGATPTREDADASVQSVKPDSPPFMARVGRGMMDIAQGTKQIYLNATDPAAGAQYTKDVGDELATYEKGVATDPGRFGVDWARILGGGSLAAAVPVAGGLGLAGLGSVAAAGAGTGALNFVPEGGSRPENAFYGGLGGPLGVLGGKAVGATAGKVINTVKGRYADPAAQATAEAAKKFGVDLRAGDLKPGLQTSENILDSVPFSGAHGRIKKQSEQLVDMLKKGEDKFMPDKIKSKEFDDPNQVMVASIKNQHTSNKVEVDGLYTKMRDLSGGAKFDPTEAKTTAIELLNKELTLPASQRNEAMVKELQGVLKWEPMDFATGHATRSRMGESLAQLERKTASGTASRVEMAAMTRLQKAVEKDMEVAANANPGLLQAWKTADKTYREKIAPYNDKSIQRIMNGEFDSDLLADKYLKTNRPNLAKEIMGLMDKDGQQAAKYAVYRRAQEAATDPNLEAKISNKAFLNKIGLGGSDSEIFDAGEKAYLDQIVDVMRNTRRASNFQADPKTGNRLTRVAMGAAPFASLLAVDPMTAAIGGIGGMAAGKAANAAFWSGFGKSALLSSGNVPGLERLTPGLLSSINTGLGSQTLMQLNRPKGR